MLLHRVRAVNTAPDSENKIHDDSVAATYGFRGGLVPGVTVYGYMTLPVLEHFGEEWLERGAATVRFKEPVYDGEEVVVEGRVVEDERLGVSLEGGRGTAVAWMEDAGAQPEAYEERPLPLEEQRPAASHETMAIGTILGTVVTTLEAADPAVLLGLANQLLIRNFVLGPWIHVGSEIRNFSAAHPGQTVTVRGFISNKYERKGHEFVVLDLLTSCEARPIQRVIHTAIWRPWHAGKPEPR